VKAQDKSHHGWCCDGYYSWLSSLPVLFSASFCCWRFVLFARLVYEKINGFCRIVLLFVVGRMLAFFLPEQRRGSDLTHIMVSDLGAGLAFFWPVVCCLGMKKVLEPVL
jgi:hypothetical protein